MKLLINEQTEKTLKAILIEKGYSFPCDGKGLCGKCRVISTDLSITNLDKTFLSMEQLEKGYRLACDKIINKPIIIDCLLEKKARTTSLTVCDLVIIFNKYSMSISVYTEGEHICDHEIVIGEKLSKQTVISYIAKEAIELMEFYKVPKATTILISGISEVTDVFLEVSFDGSDYNLPCEDVYVLKGIDWLGSNILLELLYKENSLYLIEKDKNLYINLIKDTEIVVSVLCETSLKNQIPFIKNLMDIAKVSSFFLISENTDLAFLDREFTNSTYLKPMATFNGANCLLNNRSKTAYRNLMRKIVFEDKNWEYEF